jgi:hypothetical protein
MQQLLGFVPDLPKTTPGAIVECGSLVPSVAGMDGAPTAIDVDGVGVLPTTCRGGAIGESTAGVRRLFAGTQTKLYNYLTAAWDDVSRAGSYTGSTDSRWSFAQFGDYTIAANGIDAMQQASTGDFTDIAGAPVAKIVISAANFVLAFNTIDGTYGTRPDAWWCSGIFDHTTWAPSLSTQANTGRLVASGGQINAALPFGEQVVAYKSRAMWLGSYVGGAAVWQWQQVQGDVGCVGPEAICDANGVHVFVGEDNIWAFDGVRPRPIAEGSVRQWFIDNCSPNYRYRTIVQYEKRNNRVWIFFPSQSSDTGRPDRTLVYHMVSGKWGRADMAIDAAVAFLEPTITINGLDAVAATIEELPMISFDSAYWISGAQSLAVFNAANQMQTLTGPPSSSSFTLCDIGDDYQVTHLDRFTLRFNFAPDPLVSGNISTFGGDVRMVSGGATTAGSAGNLNDGSFRPRQTGRWHVMTFNVYGETSIVGYDYSLKPAGLR